MELKAAPVAMQVVAKKKAKRGQGPRSTILRAQEIERQASGGDLRNLHALSMHARNKEPQG